MGWMAKGGRRQAAIPDPESRQEAEQDDSERMGRLREGTRGREGGHGGRTFARVRPLTSNDPWAYVDLDDCLIDGDARYPSARVIVDRLDSYTEISQSGNSLHILLEAEIGTGASAKAELGHPIPWQREGTKAEIAISGERTIIYRTGDISRAAPRSGSASSRPSTSSGRSTTSRTRRPRRPRLRPRSRTSASRTSSPRSTAGANGNEHRARCPSHNGRSDNSLSIKWGENGNLLLHCHPGCEYAEVLTVCRKRLGMRDPAPEGSTSARAEDRTWRASHPRPTPRDVRAALVRCHKFYSRFVVMPSAGRVYLAVWILHTYLFDAAETTPYPSVRSPARESGKTRVIEVTELIARDAEQIADTSISALFRSIEKFQPTILLDEVDAIFSGRDEDSKDLRRLLNAGYRKGAQVLRTVGESHEPSASPPSPPSSSRGSGGCRTRWSRAAPQSRCIASCRPKPASGCACGR